MITVYDMTSGTLRKEIEASSNAEMEGQASESNWQTTDNLQLQEVELQTEEQIDALPSAIIGCDVDLLIDQME